MFWIATKGNKYLISTSRTKIEKINVILTLSRLEKYRFVDFLPRMLNSSGIQETAHFDP